jgi:hypothetical protein
MAGLCYALCYPTTYGHFLTHGPRSEQLIWRALQKKGAQLIYRKDAQPNEPIFVIYGDILSEKTRPRQSWIS